VLVVAVLEGGSALVVESALRRQFCAFPVNVVCCACSLVAGTYLLQIAPKEVSCSRF
jgi:hypothetical protein